MNIMVSFRKKLEKYDVFTTEEKITEIFDNVNEIFNKNVSSYGADTLIFGKKERN